ncbi:hypothetical protein CLV63_10610 [Murinocardiopsis flavida]|uniref:Sugar lactone lactonase YvrE n=1 Tax=Murinocardiopsis flavida TaxID=645275 RepID=A0A2P8DL59_9ACTN|nr:hypothetical protein [Murinocardiopsis flavida]PSK97962.1 hypothetical protein CLV63_10610 [Murinocardiopsis flavida]
MRDHTLTRRTLLTAGAAATTLAVAAPAALAESPAAAGPDQGRFPSSYVLPGDRAFPTGMAFDARTGYFYVGSASSGILYRGHVNKRALREWSPDGQDGRSVTSGITTDGAGLLFVGGGTTGTLRVYAAASGKMLARLNGAEGGFLNEPTAADDGTVYATDSFRPVIYRITRTGGSWTMEHWLDVSRTPIDWVDGQHNLNGITVAGRHLLTVNSNTGQLWRIDRDTREVAEVDLGDRSLVNGDVLIWDAGRLLAVQGNLNSIPGLEPQVAVVAMDEDLLRGRYTGRYVPPGGFLHPSSAVLARGRLLVVNSQYNRWINGLPPESLPFTVSSLQVGDMIPAG